MVYHESLKPSFMTLEVVTVVCIKKYLLNKLFKFKLLDTNHATYIQKENRVIQDCPRKMFQDLD